MGTVEYTALELVIDNLGLHVRAHGTQKSDELGGRPVTKHLCDVHLVADHIVLWANNKPLHVCHDARGIQHWARKHHRMPVANIEKIYAMRATPTRDPHDAARRQMATRMATEQAGV